jgi:2-dehydro-3-deoxyphosphogluconate aldolase/(4S)-4-hydroxy-2-oxoglutarate aldolase
MEDIQNRIKALRIVPVVIMDDAAKAGSLAESLLEGGLPCAEVTFRTAAAAETIRKLTQYKDLLLGAGTVLTVDHVKAAVDSGALFIVSPGFNPKVVGYCVDHRIPVFPGICTPTEIEMGLEFGLDVFKFFPAESFGGLKTLKAVSAPYGQVKFIPTGGIHERNICDYLAFNKVIACGGSWMVPRELISEGRFREITQLISDAVLIVKKAGQVSHH